MTGLHAVRDTSPVAASDRAPHTGSQAFKRQRNLRALLKNRLSAHLFSRLREVGELAEQHHVCVYAVGGFVRDLLLGIPNLDVDLVVEGNGVAFARTFARRHDARVTVHERFGTAAVILGDGVKLDFATARTESYAYPTALPTVEPSSIEKDLYRRDFTINALALRLNTRRFGELVDFYGGQQDLQDQSIRVLHRLSFIEDPTRVFRAIRFEQRLEFRLDTETATLIKDAVTRKLVHRLSKARLSNEMIHLLSEREPRKALARLADFNLLQVLHPKLKWSPQLARRLKAVEDAIAWYARLALDRPMHQWVVYSLALLDSLPKPAVQEALSRVKFPGRQTKQMLRVAQEGDRVLRTLNQRAKPSEVFRLLHDLPDETLIFLRAKTQSRIGKRNLSAFLTTYVHATSLLNGKDLKAMGLKPGPVYQKVLDRLLDARLNGEVTTNADERHLVAQLTRRSPRRDASS